MAKRRDTCLWTHVEDSWYETGCCKTYSARTDQGIGIENPSRANRYADEITYCPFCGGKVIDQCDCFLCNSAKSHLINEAAQASGLKVVSVPLSPAVEGDLTAPKRK